MGKNGKKWQKIFVNEISIAGRLDLMCEILLRPSTFKIYFKPLTCHLLSNKFLQCAMFTVAVSVFG